MRAAPPLLLAAVLAAVVPCAAQEARPDQGTVYAVQSLAAEAARRPQCQAEDLYKFLHQALFGPGHAIANRQAAAQYLQQEIEQLGPPAAADTVCDTLGGDPILVRVNLRPFAARGFSTDELIDSFVATANEVIADPDQLTLALDLVVGWLDGDGKVELARALDELGRRLRPEGYPAIRHSSAYLQAYSPAYRVVSAASAANHGWCNVPP